MRRVRPNGGTSHLVQTEEKDQKEAQALAELNVPIDEQKVGYDKGVLKRSAVRSVPVRETPP